jgi:ATP-dependent DNA helicase RecG
MKIDNLEILNGLIAGAEGGTVEFKETTGQLERGIETLCAFLNGTRCCSV